MPRILKRPEAENDLDEIWLYIAQDNPRSADRFLDHINEKINGLAYFPKMGASRDDIKDGLRVFPVGNYLIFYFPLADGVDIVRVLHGSMEAERHFS